MTLNLLMLLFILILFSVMLFSSFRWKKKPAFLRPLRGYTRARDLLGVAAESGRTIQLAPGFGGLTSGEGADTLSGLTMVNVMSRDAVLTGTTTVVTSNDGIAYLLGANANRDAYIRSGHGDEFNSSRIRLLSHKDNVAYSVAALDVEMSDQTLGNILIGNIGYEYILLGEPTRQRNITQVVGTTQYQALPLVYMTADELLIGEEVYAAGAYLGSYPTHLGSLRAQDVLRIIIIVLLVVTFLISVVYGKDILSQW